jgi:IclR family acetate operon transcriptional repressor
LEAAVDESGGILSRYASILESLSAAPEGLSLTEISAATGLPRGTAHRLVGTLMGVGYVVRQGGRKIYVLGPRLLRLLHLGVSPASVAGLVRPILDDLVARFHETAFLAKLTGDTVETAFMLAPEDERRSLVYPGRVMPMHATASGKSILAFQDADAIETYLKAPRERYTDATRVSAQAIRADFAEVRRRGYGICDNEMEPGVLSYACPVHLDGAGVVYSIGLVGVAVGLRQHDEADVVAALIHAAARFAARLRPEGEVPFIAAAPAFATGEHMTP